MPGHPAVGLAQIVAEQELIEVELFDQMDQVVSLPLHQYDTIHSDAAWANS
jgi:hypothetical protein